MFNRRRIDQLERDLARDRQRILELERIPEPEPDPEPSLLEQHLRSRYLVTTTAGEAFDGVLFDIDAEHVVLAGAHTFDAKSNQVPIDGQVWIPRPGIAYMIKP